jgi:predicted RNA-binding Zn ribbon-like protein
VPTPVNPSPLAFAGSDPELCLAFANTAGWHASERPVEWLVGYDRLVEFGVDAAALGADSARRLLDAARARPAAAERTLGEALALREAAYRLFSAVAAGATPTAADLGTLNAALADALPRLALVLGDDGVAAAWTGAGDELDRPLWPIALSAAQLLVSGDLHVRLRECANHPCGWLFVDHSRSRTRRWCAMQGCGNRVKARRHYARRRAGETR